jgi:hypothetical protein
MEQPEMVIYRCPECGGDKLAICTKVWVNFPERRVEPEDAGDAEPTVGDHALCRNPDCQHSFQILISDNAA